MVSVHGATEDHLRGVQGGVHQTGPPSSTGATSFMERESDSAPQSRAERAIDSGSGFIMGVALGPIGSYIDSWNGDREVMPLTIEITCNSEPVPLPALSWKDESHPQWVRIRTVMDSGAAESVAPPSMAPGVVMEESPGSQRGQHYISASAGRLPNMGQQRLQVKTNEGRLESTLSDR